MQSIIENIVDSRVKNLLEIINYHFPDKLDKKLIQSEFEYIKKSIILTKQEPNNKANNNANVEDSDDNEEESEESETDDDIEEDIPTHKYIPIRKQLIKVKKRIDLEARCSGRIWYKNIKYRTTLLDVAKEKMEKKFKVSHFKDINLKAFTTKYIIGSRCSNSKTNESKYCKLHTKHLIHEDYLETPSKLLCYHFLKHGKYLD
jgi:hypothetical protein